MTVSDARTLCALENENFRLKRMLADAMLDNAALVDLAAKILTPDVTRRDVMDRHGVSERRLPGRRFAQQIFREGACGLADPHRSVFQYQKPDQGDEALRKPLRELTNKRRRFDYRRLGILLAREGFEVSHKSCSGSIAKKDSRSVADSPASGLWGRAGRSKCRIAPTSAPSRQICCVNRLPGNGITRLRVRRLCR